MKRVTQKLATLALVAIVLPFAFGTANAGSFVPKMAGTWEIVGTPDPGGCGPSMPFTNVTNVTRDGQIMNVDPVLGASVGQAYKLGKKTYGVGFFGFINPAPGLTLRLEVQSTLKLINLGEVAGKFRSIITDPNGIIPECVYEGTIEGSRLVPMPY